MLATLRRIFKAVITAAQRVVMSVALFLVYFVGVGLTWLVVMLFNRKALRRTPADAPSFWVDAQGYDVDQQSGRRQT